MDREGVRGSREAASIVWCLTEQKTCSGKKMKKLIYYLIYRKDKDVIFKNDGKEYD